MTILEVLENALYNLKRPISHEVGLNQLENAIYLMSEKDKNPYDEFNEWDLGKNHERP